MLISQHPGMIQGAFPPVSNAVQFLCDGDIFDEDAGAAIDLSDAVITVIVKDDCGNQRLIASTANGKVTLPDTDAFRISFTKSEMAGLAPCTYLLGLILELDSVEYQLILADFPVIEGTST